MAAVVAEKITFCNLDGVALFSLLYCARIFKETHTWVTHHRELLKWEEIKFITIMKKRKQTLVFLEKDTLGWKLLFDNDQVADLKDMFAEYAPDIEINDM